MRRLERTIVSSCSYDNVRSIPLVATHTDESPVTNQDKTLLPNPTPPCEPPSLKGYWNQYTNVAKGYNTRWFVLKDGVLSCGSL